MKRPPIKRAVSDTSCTMAVGLVCLPHQSICGAMTNQLYTISLESRNKTALVSPMRCESVSFPWKRPIKNAKETHKKVAAQIGSYRALPGSRIGTMWKRAPLVQHTVIPCWKGR